MVPASQMFGIALLCKLNIFGFGAVNWRYQTILGYGALGNESKPIQTLSIKMPIVVAFVAALLENTIFLAATSL